MKKTPMCAREDHFHERTAFLLDFEFVGKFSSTFFINEPSLMNPFSHGSDLNVQIARSAAKMVEGFVPSSSASI